MESTKQALESKLKNCGWTKQGKVWRLEDFCIPQITIDKFSTESNNLEASQRLIKALEFGVKSKIIIQTIQILQGS